MSATCSSFGGRLPVEDVAHPSMPLRLADREEGCDATGRAPEFRVPLAQSRETCGLCCRCAAKTILEQDHASSGLARSPAPRCAGRHGAAGQMGRPWPTCGALARIGLRWRARPPRANSSLARSLAPVQAPAGCADDDPVPDEATGKSGEGSRWPTPERRSRATRSTAPRRSHPPVARVRWPTIERHSAMLQRRWAPARPNATPQTAQSGRRVREQAPVSERTSTLQDPGRGETRQVGGQVNVIHVSQRCPRLSPERGSTFPREVIPREPNKSRELHLDPRPYPRPPSLR